MAVNVCNWKTWLEMAGNRWKWMEMDGNGWKGWKWLEIDENGWKWLHIAVDC